MKDPATIHPVDHSRPPFHERTHKTRFNTKRLQTKKKITVITGFRKVIITYLFTSDVYLGEKKVNISYRKQSAIVFDRLNAPKRKI